MKQPVWIVEGVTAREDYTLLITFTGGTQRIYDARPLLEKPIFAPLKSLPFFLRARAAYGTVIWNDDVDIAPEHLYECSTHFIPHDADDRMTDDDLKSHRLAMQEYRNGETVSHSEINWD